MAKLNREEILQGVLKTLVDGYGMRAVKAALKDLDEPVLSKSRVRKEKAPPQTESGALALIGEIDLTPEQKPLIEELARRFDQGSAFPKMADIRGFLRSHQQDATDLKARVPSFKRMLPVLTAMSSKGLEKLLARSHHSGPAELAPIADAIRGAGEDLRGGSGNDDTQP